MKITEKDMNEVILWMQFGSKIIQIGVGAYGAFRDLLSAAGIPDEQMAAAHAEYGRRIALARAQQQQYD